MPAHQYSATQALETLLTKLKGRNESLAEEIQAAIDVGKDVLETDTPHDRRKKPRKYRKTVPFTHDEALHVALNALQAYFVEQPLFVNSAATNLANSAVGIPDERQSGLQIKFDALESVSFEGIGEEKNVEIELQTETQIEKSGDETLSLKRVPLNLVDGQKRNIAALRQMVDFRKDDHGNTPRPRSRY